MAMKRKLVLNELRDDYRSDLSAQVTIGKLIEYTEADRREMKPIVDELAFKIENGQPGVAQLVLRLFKITKVAIGRSHANS